MSILIQKTEWLYSPSDTLVQTLLASVLIFIVIIILTRIIGLRSFAKFTAHDFAFTVAIGSIISSVLTGATSILHGCVAIAALLCITFFTSLLQQKSKRFSKTISNSPLLLMDGSKILEDNLAHARVEKDQLIAKLREANVLNYDQVYAVVLETKGDISVLHKSNDTDKTYFDYTLLSGVRRTP